MGLDFLELTFLIEKNCRQKFEKFDKKSVVDHFLGAQEQHIFKIKNGCFGSRVLKADWRVGRFYEVLRDHMHLICSKCGRTLLARSTTGSCPDCGEPCPHAVLTWEQFCKELGTVLLMVPAEIRQDHWLIGDLGFS